MVMKVLHAIVFFCLPLKNASLLVELLLIVINQIFISFTMNGKFSVDFGFIVFKALDNLQVASFVFWRKITFSCMHA
jgi:hypothetical protein